MGELSIYRERLKQALACAERITLEALHGEHTVHHKGDKDFALCVDLEVEKAVREILQTGEHGLPVLGEEFAWDEQGSGEQHWVVDPVDGTINYSRGLPLFGCCIALVVKGEAVLAGITFPALNEQYLAQRGEGAFLNGERLAIQPVGSLAKAMVSCGDFAVGENAKARNQVRLGLVNQLAERVMRLRMLGSAAVQLAWLAAGRLDLSVVLSNKPWDVQAGVLIAREAGAMAYDWDGGEHSMESLYTVVSHSALKDEFLPLLQPLLDK